MQRFSRPRDPWFFLHAHTKLNHNLPDPSTCRTCALQKPAHRSHPTNNPPMVELIPVKDYLFRYDRGAFWMGSYGWDAMPFSFSPLGRRLLDPLFKTRTMYSIMHHSGQSQRFVVQDLAIPPANAKAFLEFVSNELRIWPLWVCPIKGGSRVPFHDKLGMEKTGKGEMLINVGVWGIPHTSLNRPIYYGRRTFPSFILLNRMIEAKVRQLGGLKWLYAHNYAMEDEFWESYDKGGYGELRKRWKAEDLPTVWDKVGREEHVWISKSILRGFWKGWLGRDYLLRRGGK